MSSLSDVPLFSIVVPAFNAASTIRAAVASALSQTETNLEIVVVDDGSTDATASLASGIDDQRVRVISQENRGLPGARNAGIRASHGTYVSLLDSDDLLLPSYLELTARALAATPGAGFAYTDAFVFDESSGKVRRRSAMQRNNPPAPPPSDRDGFLLELLRRNFVYVATTIPRRVLDDVGLFEETLTSAEDYELWLRILLRGYRAAWVPGRHALYRKHAGQMSRNLVNMSRTLLQVYDSLSMDEMPTEAHRELLAERRRSTRRATDLLSRTAWMIPQRLLAAAKRTGIGESWYDQPPAEIAATFPDLTDV